MATCLRKHGPIAAILILAVAVGAGAWQYPARPWLAVAFVAIAGVAGGLLWRSWHQPPDRGFSEQNACLTDCPRSDIKQNIIFEIRSLESDLQILKQPDGHTTSFPGAEEVIRQCEELARRIRAATACLFPREILIYQLLLEARQKI